MLLIVEFLVKSTIILTVFLAIGSWVKFSAAERHSLILAGMLAVIILPFASQVVEWEFHVFQTDSHGEQRQLDSDFTAAPFSVPSKWQIPEIGAIALGVFSISIALGAISIQAAQIESRPLTPLIKVAPIYPENALTERVEGFVVIGYDVTPEGTTQNFRVVRENPPGYFAEVSISAAGDFKYLPEIESGERVWTKDVENKFSFEITGDPSDDDGLMVYSEDSTSQLQFALQESKPIDHELAKRIGFATQAERAKRLRMLATMMDQADQAARQDGRGDQFVSIAYIAHDFEEYEHAIYCLFTSIQLFLSLKCLIKGILI